MVAENSSKSIDVVAGVMISDSRILLCQRHESGAFPLKWEFPGGKIERGEAPAVALKRELREELAITIEAALPIFYHRHEYPSGLQVKLNFFQVAGFSGGIENKVFQTIKWVEINDVLKYDLLEGDVPFVQQLQSGSLIISRF